MYKEKQWDRFAKFDSKATKNLFNVPYVLLKAKNMHAENRADIWHKARPIAPQTKHPMKKLFHLTGRAWSHITANLPGEHFVIKHGGEVPKFLHESVDKLKPGDGRIKFAIKDIVGCFPNMPKEAIRLGLREMLKKVEMEWGFNSVIVPHKDSERCTWTTRKKYGVTKIPFETLMEVMEFALDNTFIQDLSGNLWRQIKGIPMGDPHSPGMTIGACAWMEHEWMQTLSPPVKDRFTAARYMDDILMLYKEDDNFDSTSFLCDLERSECYWKPLALEDGKEGTFLETTFHIDENNDCTYWLKNDNECGKPKKIWRYAHFHSYATLMQKNKVLRATLRKVHNMSSNDDVLVSSAIQKLHEFMDLLYPAKYIASACNFMATTTRNPAWFKIRSSVVRQIPTRY